jgi:adenosylmethionine-8-amino-7-oxononanoate aminotransferase
MTASTHASNATLTTQERAKKYLRHLIVDFDALDRDYPGAFPKVIVAGEGAYLIDEHGNRVLDAGTHLGACQIGHGRPEVADAIARQVRTLEFVALDGGVTHPAAVDLAERLSAMAACDDANLSFTSSGSEANELAIKIARAYHARRGEPQRTKILSRSGSYHGWTYAGLAATGMAAFKAGFGGLAPDFLQTTQPSPGRCGHCGQDVACTLACLDDLERLAVAEGPETVAAVIAEPVAIPQAVKVPHPDYFRRLRSFCDRHGILLIIDEVVCGFGRTGRMFGSDHFGVRGDMVTYAKGLTSGYVPMGAVAVSGAVNAVFAKRPLVHLNTYAGHPVACAAAQACLDIMEDEQLVANAAGMELVLRRELERMSQAVPRVREISVIGLLSSVVLDIAGIDDRDELIRRMRHLAYDNGLLARFAKDADEMSVHFYPPLVVGEDDIVDGVAALERTLRHV